MKMSRPVTLVMVSLANIMMSSTASSGCEATGVPAGARQRSYGALAIDVCPKASDVAMEGDGKFNLYNGIWYTREIPPRTSYSSRDGALTIALGGIVTTVPRTMVSGKLPLLSGKKGFYVEFEVSLSDNDPDHWPAVWLMPIEHNGRQDDAYPSDPPKYERWLEIDVDEAGFARGYKGAAISWFGIWPNYRRIQNKQIIDNEFLDRTKRHRFGASFDPARMSIDFWLDDIFQYSASGDAVPEVALRQNFYLIISAESHGKRAAYDMKLWRFRAYVP